MYTGFWWETEGNRPHERTRFRYYNIKMGQCGLELSDSGKGQLVGCFQLGSETLGSIKHREFVNQLGSY